MNVKKILLISLLAVAIIASVSAVSAGLFDGLFGGNPQDNVIEMDNITFNTTNVTKFKLFNESKEDYGNYKWYVDENDTGYNVYIINCSDVDDSTFNEVAKLYEDNYDNLPVQTINGIVVYTTSAKTGAHVGEPRYEAYIENNDLNTIIDIFSPDPNETAKMASTLKFK